MPFPGSEFSRNAANHVPLSPISFLNRTADVYPDRAAIRYGSLSWTYREYADRCLRLGAALVRAGIVPGDVVSIIAPNTPAHLEAHFGVAMAGAVLHSINIRLDAASIAFMLGHAETKLLLVDAEFAALARQAMVLLDRDLIVVDIADPAVVADLIGIAEYETFIAPDPGAFRPLPPADEWDAITLNYTSGTTGDPKGVIYHHRGAYLNALGNGLAFGLATHPIYLWTLPLFHCNGWCFPWTITAFGGTHVCLRRVDAAAIVAALVEEGITHLCGAPVVLNMLVNTDESLRQRIPRGLQIMTAGAPPPAAVLAKIEALGCRVTHTYGLTELYGPCVVCEWQPEWDILPAEDRARLGARQGVRYLLQEDLTVLDPETMRAVPTDGTTMGEVMMRGNIAMKGYLKNPDATAKAFAGGWFHTGDLAVEHADGYIEVRDRSKDIVISGGENISTIEVEGALYRYPAVLEAAVVARPDDKWGETPCAFVALKPGATATESELIAFCRDHLAAFKLPKTIVFTELPKTATGKIQKFALRDRARDLP